MPTKSAEAAVALKAIKASRHSERSLRVRKPSTALAQLSPRAKQPLAPQYSAVEASVRAILLRQEDCQCLMPEDVAAVAQDLRRQIAPFAQWLNQMVLQSTQKAPAARHLGMGVGRAVAGQSARR